MATVSVRAVNTDDELQRYVDFGNVVYREDPRWVPTDADHLAELLSGRGGFGPESQIQAFWAEEGDHVMATVAAVRNESYNLRWNEQMGHLLFFEALPNQDRAVESLWRAAYDWLRGRGCQAVRMSILPGMQLPLTVDAYDTIPTVFHTYNPPYYHSYIKNGGFRTEHGAVQYQIQFTPELAQRYREMVQYAERSGVSLRSWDFDRLDEETVTFTDLFNETFNAHWGFMPLPAAVTQGFTVGLKDLLVPDFTAFAEVEGQMAGFVYSMPDLNQALHAMRGKAIEDHLPQFQQCLQGIDHGVLLIIGVRERYRGRGINLALASKSYLAMIERGYKTGSYTVVLDDNWRSRRTAEKLGGRVTRNFIVYRRELV